MRKSALTSRKHKGTSENGKYEGDSFKLFPVTKWIRDKVSFNFISPRNNLNKPFFPEISTPEAIYFCYNSRFFPMVSQKLANMKGKLVSIMRNSKKPKFILQITACKKKSYFYRVKMLIRGERNYIRLKRNMKSNIVCL